MIAKGERGLRCRIAFTGGDKRARRALRDTLRNTGLDVVVEANGPYGTAVTIWHGHAYQRAGYALAEALTAVLEYWPDDLPSGYMTATVAPRERTR